MIQLEDTKTLPLPLDAPRVRPRANRKPRIKDTATECAELVALVADLVIARAAQLADVQARMAVLQKAGMIKASEWWKDQKYLYLVYPTNGVTRKREYIGTDPAKISAARDAIVRQADYARLDQVRLQLERQILQARGTLQRAVYELRE